MGHKLFIQKWHLWVLNFPVGVLVCLVHKVCCCRNWYEQRQRGTVRHGSKLIPSRSAQNIVSYETFYYRKSHGTLQVLVVNSSTPLPPLFCASWAPLWDTLLMMMLSSSKRSQRVKIFSDILFYAMIIKVEKILKSSLNSIQSSSPSMKIHTMRGKFAWGVKAKHWWSLPTKFRRQKVCWHHLAMFCLITSR